MPKSRRPRTAPSCSGAIASGTGAFDSTSEFGTNKSATATFGGSNFAGAGYSGALEGSGNTICDYNSVIVGGNMDTIDSGSGNTPAGAAYSIIGAGVSNTISNSYSIIGAGTSNTISTSYSFIGAGTGNTVSNYESGIGAGATNTVSGYDSFVGSGIGNGLSGTVSYIGGGHNNSVAGHLSFVGAGYGNQVSGDGSFIGAGGDVTAALPNNQISGLDSFIGAGDENTVAASEAVVGGGFSNSILNTGGAAGGQFGFVGGGYQNSIQPYVAGGGEYGVLAGGADNIVYGIAATIGGGVNNRANGEYATIPGGRNNNANGIGSFAAGTGARATANGTFVWSDNASTASLAATGNYQFVARASGGYTLYSNPGATVGVKLAAGSGTWASVSDRAAKTRIRPLDDAEVLAKVAALPIESWQYRTEDARVRHVGPMAQDFYRAFGVGEDDRHITSIDEDGVALAAIKALHSENVALRAEIRGLEAKFASIRTH